MYPRNGTLTSIKQVKALSQLSHLTILVLIPDSDDTLEQDELTKVAAACESLKRIDFEDDGNFSSYRCDHSTKPPRIYTIDLDDSERILWPDNYCWTSGPGSQVHTYTVETIS